MMWYWGNGGWGWGGGIMAIIMIIFWAFVVWAIIWGFRRLSHHGYAGEGKNPLDIAKERLARGEITKEQYEDIKKTLNS